MAKAKKPAAIRHTPQRKRHFIKEWREFRDLTQRELGEMAGMSENNISQLENNKQSYSSEGLEALARALKTKTGYLLLFDPHTVDRAILEAWDAASESERTQILAVTMAIVKKTGT